MVRGQLKARGICDNRVLHAMRTVPRERFVPAQHKSSAYSDGPLPLGYRQTISQPYIVAYMLEELRIQPEDRALEVGVGSGYAAALLGMLARKVYAVERIRALAEAARQRLSELGCKNIAVRHGNGFEGWEQHAPFDVIMVSAGGREVPQPLLRQLATGGRLLIPVGPGMDGQRLVRIVRTDEGNYSQEMLQAVAFVPLLDSLDNT